MFNMLGQIGSSLISGGFQLGAEKANFKHQKELADQQNQFNLDMWKMNNEYNSPQAQMQRLKDAGLNPMLMYGQGTTGNSSSPPSQVTPNAPHYGKAAQELAKAFNLEAIKTAIAERKKKEAEAKDAGVNATRNERELFAEETLGNKYVFDYKRGMFVERPKDAANVVSVVHPSAFYVNRFLSNNYRQNSFIPLRNEYQGYINNMANYDAKYYPVSYWVNQGGHVVKSIGEVTSWFNPSRYLMPLKRGGQFIAPNGKVYNY